MAGSFQVISFNEPTTRVREHKKRQFRAKTRAGCVACKQKRVKCDEARPVCVRCQRNKRTCLYDTTGLTSSRVGGSSSPEDRLSVTTSPGLNTTLSAMSTIEAVLPADCAVKFGGTPAGVLLEFFNENHGHMLSGAPLPAVWDIACRFPHLLTAILSASACYLRHHTSNPLPHQMAEVYQQTLTVQSFQRSLEQPMTRERSDALLLTSIFLNLLAFAAVRDDDPLTSWVFSDDPGRLGWMTILLGFKPLFMASIRYMHESVLLSMYETTGAQTTKFTGASFDKFELPPAWRLFTRLCADAGTDAAITDEAVRALYATRFVPPDMAYMHVFMQFFGRLDGPFRDLLLRGDGRALWMVGYWLGLLGRLDAWFARARVRRDHAAVVMCLRARGIAGREGQEGWMWACLLDELEGLRVDWHPSNLGGRVLEACPAASA